MSARRGRPLKPRTDSERLAYLVKLLGSGHERRDVVLHWAGHQLIVGHSPKESARPYVVASEGLELGSVIDHAIATHYRRGDR